VQFSPTSSYKLCPNGQADCGATTFCVAVGGAPALCLPTCA
jgi:hypothetical protein